MTGQKKEFFDKARKTMSKFYDLQDIGRLSDVNLRVLIREDPDFYDSYLFLADNYKDSEQLKESKRLESESFKRALSRIQDKNGNWPDEMPWGWLENRHVIRALGRGADNLWMDGRNDEALDIYRKLLHSNLNDNIGARYAIIALRHGFTYDKYMEQVWLASAVPADHIMKWFRKYALKFPEELKEWKKYCREELGLTDIQLM